MATMSQTRSLITRGGELPISPSDNEKGKSQYKGVDFLNDAKEAPASLHEIVWECQDCDVKLISINGKRSFDTKYGIKPYTQSWDRFISLDRNCKHERKVWSDHYCKVCGKRLSNHKSIEREMGHVCYSKTKQARLDMTIAKEIRERHFDHKGW
jgi:ribosomal protein L34E